MLKNKKTEEIYMRQFQRFYLAAMVAGLLCSGLMFVTNASAADKNPCSEYIEKFCKNVEPGMIAIMNCLQKHENELSDACKDYEAKRGGPRAERREEVREMITYRQTCMNDLARFCRETNPEQGGILKCLKSHGNEISAPCRESIKAMDE
jgi:hypothetical protein